jgi:hypothetical protein
MKYAEEASGYLYLQPTEVAAKVGELPVIAPMLNALVAGAPSPLRLKGERYRARTCAR